MNDLFRSEYIDKCVISGGNTIKVLDLGQHSYADTFISKEQASWSEPVFPLQVNLCPESGHLQLAYVSEAEERYNLYPYSYTSSNSAFSRNHWDKYAAEVISEHQPTGLVVEIGSNDGYLVGQFKDSCSILGVDLASQMCEIAEQNGVRTLHAAFGTDIVTDVISEYGTADVVMANNVLNHANNPVDFVQSASTLIGNSGVFIFEMPYWLSMIDSDRFIDMVYHEHVSYFTVKSVKNLLDRANLVAVDIKVVDYHGGSLRVTAASKSNNSESAKIGHMIRVEEDRGLFNPAFYSVLMKKFASERIKWLKDFYAFKEANPDAVVIGVGAAAKANTWLVWHGLNKNDLAFVTDSSEFKQGKFTPLTRIPIVGDEIFAEYSNPCALVLSWNIGARLKDALLKINPNTTFISQ